VSYYAVGLDVRERACVVVGGGAVAERRVRGLLACDARVTVIAPTVTPALAGLAAEGRIAHLARTFAAGDLANAWLAVAATDRPAVNASVADEARARGVLVNVASEAARGDFIVMAPLRRGGLQVAIATDGLSPALTRRVRADLERLLPPEYEDLLRVQADLRAELRAAGIAVPAARWQSAVDETVLDALHAGDEANARVRLRARLIAGEAGPTCS
jgi:siroheme synthase-like protein